MKFTPAIKSQSRLRLAICGTAGTGKTWTSLAIATHLVPGGRIAVIDTERGSASLYADAFTFDAVDLETHSPDTYVEAIQAAEAADYDVLVIDSLSHAWMGRDGALELVGKAEARDRNANSFTAWKGVTPKHLRLVDAIVSSRCHVIATMRTKTEWVLEKDEKTGKTAPRRIGTATVQRDGVEFEFGVVGEIDLDHKLVITKTRCSALADAVIEKPGKQLATVLRDWLGSGVAPTERRAPPQVAPVVVERIAAPVVVEQLAVAPSPVLAEIADQAFAAYLDAMRGAADVAALDRLAVQPGRPVKGTPEHATAIAEYRRIKAALSANGVGAANGAV